MEQPIQQAIQPVKKQWEEAHKAIGKIWFGDEFVIDLLLISILAKGHLLLEDVPGVGKTTLAKTLAAVLGVQYNRIQFTNDLLPADVLGGSVYNPNEGAFSFTPGPIFTDFLLADEINRAPTRSQSAFLQAMEESCVVCDGVNHRLSEMFTVIATQNPIDFDSTNPLPEAQLDRFLIRTSLGFPKFEEEVLLLSESPANHIDEIEPVLDPVQIQAHRALVPKIHLHPDLAHYIVVLARGLRSDHRLSLGISPRGCMHLAMASRARALLKGRSHVNPEDVQQLIPYVWGHRLLHRKGKDHDRFQSVMLLEELIQKIPVPR